MRRKLVLIVLMILSSGTIATLISGLYKQDLSVLGQSITGYGFPLSWHRESYIIYPSSPTTYSFSGESFALDIAFWSLIITVPVAATLRLFKTRKQT
jgi:hypothetical protein